MTEQDIQKAMELAREIDNGGNGQGHSYFELFRNARKVARALIAFQEPVEAEPHEWAADRLA